MWGTISVGRALLTASVSRQRRALGIARRSTRAALLSVGAYPVWSVIILVLDGLVIYALTVYGDALHRR